MKCFCYSKFHVASLGLTLGIIWGVAVFLFGLIAIAVGGWGVAFVGNMGSLYIGYKPTLVGSLIGGVWAFIHMFITGILIAWIYNAFVRCCNKKGTTVCSCCGGEKNKVDMR